MRWLNESLLLRGAGMTKQEIDKEIFKFDKNIKKCSREHWAYRLLLSFPVTGPFDSSEDLINKSKEYWSVETDRLSTMCRRAINNGIVKYGPRNKTRFLGSEIYDDGIAMALGCATLLGLVKRVKK